MSTRPGARPGANPRDRTPRPTRAASTTLALLASLAIAPTAAEDTIFKKVEADGSVTFTDQPLPDAEVTEGSPISVVGPDPSVAVVPAATGGANATAAVPTGSAAPSDVLPELPEEPVASAVDDAPAVGAAAAAADRDPGQDSVEGDAPGAADAVSGQPVIARLSIAAPPDGSTVIDAGQAIGVMVVADPPLDGAAQRVQVEIAVDGTVVAAGPLGTLDVPMPDRGEHVLSARVYDMTGAQLAESEPSVLHVQKPARP